MSKFQNVDFRSVEEFLEYLPDEEKYIVDLLRAYVLEAIPEVHEKLSYNVPYYSRFARICFIWPASIPWGKVPRSGVLFGFCKGYLLEDGAGYLEKGNRRQVHTKTFFKPSEIDFEILGSYLYDAILLDEASKK